MDLSQELPQEDIALSLLPKSANAKTEHSKMSWFYLFYDLIFVSAMAKIGSTYRIADEEDNPFALLIVLSIFIPMFVIWSHNNFYFVQHGAEDMLHILYYLFQMIAITYMSMNISECGESYLTPSMTNGTAEHHCEGFTGSICAVRVVYTFMWIRIIYSNRQQGILTVDLITLAVHSVSALLWGILSISSVQISVNAFVSIWWTVICIDILIFFALLLLHSYLTGVSLKESRPYDADLIEERLGLYVILVLGEAVVASTSFDVENSRKFIQDPVLMLRGASACAIAFFLQLIYFKGGQHAEDEVGLHALRLSEIREVTYLWLHVPFTASIIVYAQEIDLAIAHNHMKLHNKWVLAVCLVVSLTSFVLMQLLHQGAGLHQRRLSKQQRLMAFLIAIVLLILMPVVLSAVPVTLYLCIVALIISSLGIVQFVGREIRH